MLLANPFGCDSGLGEDLYTVEDPGSFLSVTKEWIIPFPLSGSGILFAFAALRNAVGSGKETGGY